MVFLFEGSNWNEADAATEVVVVVCSTLLSHWPDSVRLVVVVVACDYDHDDD